MQLKNFKHGLVFLLFIMTGVVLGGFLGDAASGISALSFLSYGHTFGISAGSPMVLDLYFIKITFGLVLKLNICMIIGIIFSILLYKKLL